MLICHPDFITQYIPLQFSLIAQYNVSQYSLIAHAALSSNTMLPRPNYLQPHYNLAIFHVARLHTLFYTFPNLLPNTFSNSLPNPSSRCIRTGMLEYIGEIKKHHAMKDMTDAKKMNQRIAQELASQHKKINLKHDDWLGEVMSCDVRILSTLEH